MGDGKNEHALCLNLESNEIGELLQKGFPNGNWRGVRPGPKRIEVGGFFET
jgi:hypothetical protein